MIRMNGRKIGSMSVNKVQDNAFKIMRRIYGTPNVEKLANSSICRRRDGNQKQNSNWVQASSLRFSTFFKNRLCHQFDQTLTHVTFANIRPMSTLGEPGWPGWRPMLPNAIEDMSNLIQFSPQKNQKTQDGMLE